MKKSITRTLVLLLLTFTFSLSTVFAQTAFITNSGDNSVSVINIATNTVTATITGLSFPFGVSVSPDSSKVYITNFNTVSVINTATNTVTDTITVGTHPFGICVSPDGLKVYVANYNDNTVSVINSATNTVSATITVGTYPHGVNVSPDGSKIYVANNSSNTVSVINSATNTVSATITVGNAPAAFGNFISTYPLITGIASPSIVSAGIEVYPNPTTNNITIEATQQATIEISNIQGQLIETLATTGNKTNIDVSALAKGMYFVKVKTEKGVESKKFVKL